MIENEFSKRKTVYENDIIKLFETGEDEPKFVGIIKNKSNNLIEISFTQKHKSIELCVDDWTGFINKNEWEHVLTAFINEDFEIKVGDSGVTVEERHKQNILNGKYKRYEAVLGPNSKQWWVYDNLTDEYCDPPSEVLKDIDEKFKNWRYSSEVDEAQNYFDELLKDEPDWLNDEGYRYSGEIGI